MTFAEDSPAQRVLTESPSVMRWEMLELSAGDIMFMLFLAAFGIAWIGALVLGASIAES